jgi:hypothetical protein
LNQSLFTPQQKTELSIGTPLSQPQASPISKPIGAVLPQSSTPVQQPSVFQPRIAHVEPVLQQKVGDKQVSIWV